MKLITVRVALLLAALAITLSPLHAQPVASTGYSLTSVYTDPNSNSINAFAYTPTGTLYYETSSGGGFALYQGGNPTAITSATGSYPGSGMVYSGGYLFLNDGNNNIYAYNTAGGSFSSTPIANIPNYSMAVNSGKLYLNGFGSTNQIAVSGISGGTLTSSGTTIETDGNYPGALAFDANGNLYYASGGATTPDSTTFVIYKWTAGEVANALSNPTGDPLTLSGSNAWFDYSLTYNLTGTYAGATGLAVDGNQLVFTLSNFGNPSTLIGVDINSDGSAGSSDTLATDTGASGFLSQVQVNNGVLYVSDGDQIFEVQAVPEPSIYALVALGLIGLGFVHYRRRVRLASAAAVTSLLFFR